jgi:hypothetical protein
MQGGFGPAAFRFATGNPTALGAWSSFFDENAAFNADFSGDVPEPSTWPMVLLGFAGLGFAGYRRARAA